VNVAASAPATSAQGDRAVALRGYLADRLSTDLPAFTKKAFQVLYPNRKLVWSLHVATLRPLVRVSATNQGAPSITVNHQHSPTNT